jgi:hypothetical protein
VEVETPKSYRRFSGKVLDYAMKEGERSYVLLYGRCQAGAFIAPDGSFEGIAPPGKYKAYCVPSSRIGNGFKVKMNPVEIVIEEGKDLGGIEIP